MPNLIRRRLKLIDKSENDQIREVTQLHYLSWPDHGAPEKTDFQIINTLIDFTRAHLYSSCDSKEDDCAIRLG
jgi:protein tyrosine phosphatase